MTPSILSHHDLDRIMRRARAFGDEHLCELTWAGVFALGVIEIAAIALGIWWLACSA